MKYQLDHDMLRADWFLDKVKKSDSYAQNVYAALCNMRWQKLEIVPILTEELWHSTWRCAGSIVANMRGEGSYIDWYCSGIGDDDFGHGLTGTKGEGYVSEGKITDEVLNDFKNLGWIPVPWKDQDST